MPLKKEVYPSNIGKDKERYRTAAQKKLFDTGSPEQAERYANHITKAAINRRKKEPEPKGKP